MDTNLISSIQSVGFPIVAAILVWLALLKDHNKMSDEFYKLVDNLEEKLNK